MNGFGPDGGASLAECIKSNGTLLELNVNGNRLNTPNAFAIAQALAVNTTLQVLKVSRNYREVSGRFDEFRWQTTKSIPMAL